VWFVNCGLNFVKQKTNACIMLIYIIVIYLLVTFILTIAGIDSKSEGIKIFIISLLLTPIVGLILLIRQRKKATTIHYYYCKECDYVFPVKMRHCPICYENDKKVKLVKYQSPHKTEKLIQQLNLT